MDLAMPSTPQTCALDTCGYMWVPLCLCTTDGLWTCVSQPLLEPGGKGSQCGDTFLVHTGPILSHSHWMDSALEIKTTDREQPTRPSSCSSWHPCQRA